MPTRAVFLVTHNIEEAVLLADRVVVLGKNPGRIRTDLQVPLPHPRDKKSEPFQNLVDYIYTVLTRPDEAPAKAPSGRPEAAAPAPRYPMLPHARPGGVAGLLEMLEDRGGRSDISKLADDLGFAIDELLPIVDAAALLGFATVAEGDVEMTAAGREFAAADILSRKDLFRRAAFHNVALLRQITRALATKRDHSIPDEFFHDILDEHFSEEETVRQLETAITWGRFAELFDHDAKERRFYLPEEAAEVDRAWSGFRCSGGPSPPRARAPRFTTGWCSAPSLPPSA